MKFINSIQGTVAIHATNDDVGPRDGVLPSDMIEYVGNLYNFRNKPPVPNGFQPHALALPFHFGHFTTNEGRKIPIQLLNIFSDGDAITAQDTDLADMIMTDYQQRMDNGLRFRYSDAAPERMYLSAIVVEFTPEFTERAHTISAIEAALATSLGRPKPAYKFKRLAFGPEAVAGVVLAQSVLTTMPQDFSIERRGNEPMERNRFFCVAPLPLRHHLAALEAVEKAATA